MKKLQILYIFILTLIGCSQQEKTKKMEFDAFQLEGEWDNFLQYWQENTEEDLHRVETDDKHRHFSLNIDSISHDLYEVEIREGRNGRTFVDKIQVDRNKMTENGFTLKNDTLFVTGKNHFQNKNPYVFARARKFSGWIECPLPDDPDSTYHQGNLEIHDQGGMAALDLEGVDYTVELTQLVFAKKLGIMKLAIYDMPLDSVGINSRSISYTWVNPNAKRIGINLRKIISGWTYIEPGFQNQNSWKKDEE